MSSLFGIDTSGHASHSLQTQAAPWIGGSPKFWGRYFNGTSNVKYQYAKSENAVLHQLGVPLLCFARQMWAVSDPSNASAHAQANMKGLVDAIGAQYLLDHDISPMMFLDIEPETHHPEHVMGQTYYEKWSTAMVAGFSASAGTIRFRPAVYLNQGDNRQSWLNLNAAVAGGAACAGVSEARYLHDKFSDPPMYNTMVWNDAERTPEPNPIPHGQPNAHIPVLVWQYHGDYLSVTLPNGHVRDGDLDFEMVNPAYNNVVLSGLVPTPAV